MLHERQQPYVMHYADFNRSLKRLISNDTQDSEWRKGTDAALNGFAGIELRRLIELEVLRDIGAFFTGSDLASNLLKSARMRANDVFVYDPAVGAGDLLLAAARKFPCEQTVETTLKSWGQKLAGTDIFPEFVECVRLRLALLALSRHGKSSKLPKNWKCLLPHIQCRDGMLPNEFYSKASHLIINPPFGSIPAPEGCKWSSGKTSRAAIFLEQSFQACKGGAKFYAILPDVLRSGSFHKKWRDRISDLAKINNVQRSGVFDKLADVDVFLFKGQIRDSEKETAGRWPEQIAADSTVGQYFSVNVGKVVPYRDEQTGPLHPYIEPKNVRLWSEISDFDQTRRHKAMPFHPPFVAIRRTSRPGQNYRAAASIIRGDQPVAVENHLIVCSPLDGNLTSCRKLMKQLRHESINEFLDEKISCRHLTVSAVASIPFQPE